jgi:hypothetical protein
MDYPVLERAFSTHLEENPFLFGSLK